MRTVLVLSKNKCSELRRSFVVICVLTILVEAQHHNWRFEKVSLRDRHEQNAQDHHLSHKEIKHNRYQSINSLQYLDSNIRNNRSQNLFKGSLPSKRYEMRHRTIKMDNARSLKGRGDHEEHSRMLVKSLSLTEDGSLFQPQPTPEDVINSVVIKGTFGVDITEQINKTSEYLIEFIYNATELWVCKCNI